MLLQQQAAKAAAIRAPYNTVVAISHRKKLDRKKKTQTAGLAAHKTKNSQGSSSTHAKKPQRSPKPRHSIQPTLSLREEGTGIHEYVNTDLFREFDPPNPTFSLSLTAVSLDLSRVVNRRLRLRSQKASLMHMNLLRARTDDSRRSGCPNRPLSSATSRTCRRRAR